jgi:Ca-activated chloride channel family protein
MYRLEHPWLLAIIPLPLVLYWLLPPYREEQDSLRITFFDFMASSLGLTPQHQAVILRTNWLEKIVNVLSWSLFVVALARPQYIEPPIQKIEPGRDLMLALDISQSMETPDFRTPDGKRMRRVDAVKQVVADFIRRREHDKIGLIVFGQTAYPVTPFTLDHKACQQMLSQIDAGMAGPQTMIGDAIGLAIKQFNASDAKQRVLILLTDGNDTGSRMPPRRAAEIAKDNHIVIHAVGLGDPHATGEDKMDYSTLEQIASSTRGKVFHGENRAELENAYRELDRITPQNFKTLSYQPRRELAMIPIAGALVLAVGYNVLMLLIGIGMSLWHSQSQKVSGTQATETAMLKVRL